MKLIWYFLKVCKTDKTLAKFIKERKKKKQTNRGKDQINKIRNDFLFWYHRNMNNSKTVLWTMLTN